MSSSRERDTFKKERKRMVDVQIRRRGLKDRRVLTAMEKVPRHLFVPENMAGWAYADEPLPIGAGQTISQPYIVGYMTDALKLSGGEKVLEIGTGSGYQTAVLAEMAAEVYTVELIESLAARARELLEGLGYTNIRFKTDDGSRGWPEAAPFDAVMVTAAANVIPASLEEQLAEGGRMIIPVGVDFQELVLVKKGARGLERESLIPVRFVPLVSTS